MINRVLSMLVLAIVLIFAVASQTFVAGEPNPEAIPKGAVIPFNLDRCPPGWNGFPEAEGRMIIGAGTKYGLGKKGGSETISIGPENMPSHSHFLEGALNGRPLPWGPGSHPIPTRVPEKSGDIWRQGDGKKIKAMPPWYGLLYCQKTR